jgi:hypothetical protein
LPEPSDREKARIETARTAQGARSVPPLLRITTLRQDTAATTQVSFEAPHADTQGWGARLSETLGSVSPDFVNSELARLLNALNSRAGAPNEDEVNGAIALIHGMAPRSELEATLGVQIAATHAASMDMLRQVRSAASPELADRYGTLLTKLQRTFLAQVESFSKLRRGGEQVVRVEHVHVYPGGQAIVGTVNAPGRVAGGSSADGRQAHGATDPRALAFTPGEALWGQEPERSAVPARGSEGQDPLSHARRRPRKRGS